MACAVNLFRLSQFCLLIFDLRIWFHGTLSAYSWQKLLRLFITRISALCYYTVSCCLTALQNNCFTEKNGQALSQSPYRDLERDRFVHLYVPDLCREKYYMWPCLLLSRPKLSFQPWKVKISRLDLEEHKQIKIYWVSWNQIPVLVHCVSDWHYGKAKTTCGCCSYFRFNQIW